MSYKKTDYSDSEEEWDIDAYFSKPYVPLSNLPTPPLSAHSNESSRQHTPDFEFDDDESLDPELLGPALHLSNLIPPTTSLTAPSHRLIQAMLARTALPPATLALAAIILDSLNSRFALSWRKALTPTLQSPTSKATPNPKELHPLRQHPSSTPRLTTHQSLQQFLSIDTLRPELLPLSALILANKFLNDSESSTTHYASAWGKAIWSVEQINIAQKIVCENLGWRILPLCERHLIEEAEETMRRVGEGAKRERLREENSRVRKSFVLKKIADVEVLGMKKGHVRIQSTEFVPVYGDLGMDFD